MRRSYTAYYYYKYCHTDKHDEEMPLQSHIVNASLGEVWLVYVFKSYFSSNFDVFYNPINLHAAIFP